MVAWRCVSISAELGTSFDGPLRMRSTVARAARSRLATAFIAFARAAAVRPACRPNTNASVMALPDSRFAPLAPPTASPRPADPAPRSAFSRRLRHRHVVVRDRRHLDRILVRSMPSPRGDRSPAECLAKLFRRTCWKLRYAPPCGEPRRLDLLDDRVGARSRVIHISVLRHAVAVGETPPCPC